MRWLFAIWLLVSSCSSFADEIGPKSGALVAVGGGRMPPEIIDEFIKLGGGKSAKFVIIPTANTGEDWGETYVTRSFLKKSGVEQVSVLHTRDRDVADSEDFVKSLQQATGVWIDGGRQWRLADVYLGTRTQREIAAVVQRGGVVGGSSAGATIIGSYLVRGAPEGNHIMMAKGHEEGFGLLKSAAIDQHVIARKRHLDLVPVIDAHPELLGFGIDEATAIVVQANRLRVIGASHVLVHGRRVPTDPEKPYLTLKSGESFDLEKRQRD